MSLLRIGDRAPDFKLKGILHDQIGDYSPANYKNKWLVLFFYPADFTFICPTEVTGFSKLAKAFAAEGAMVLGVSVDAVDSHRSWAVELGGLECPLLSDEAKTVSQAYGVLDEKEGVALRATFIVNPAGMICYQVVSHVNVGRSVEETLRVLKALRTERLCPSDWKPGDATGDIGLKY
ncbi:MAG: peroxiredoxin [Deltaproteobacteria bacterium]|nr:peroxiredoxin [Deltaproteobacteria bacterium]